LTKADIEPSFLCPLAQAGWILWHPWPLWRCAIR